MSQSLEALAKANEVRFRRSAMMKGLKSGELHITDIDLTADWLRTMKVSQFLQCLPWQRRQGTPRPIRGGAKSASRVINEMEMLPGTTLGALSVSRRKHLVQTVIKRCPTQ